MQLMLVAVPPGVRAGELICVSAKGQLFMVTVPGDLGPGRQFQVAMRGAAAQAGDAAARLPGIGRLGHGYVEVHETAEEAAAREAAAVQETAAQEAAAAEEAAAREAAAAEEAAAQEAAAVAREAVLEERKKKKALAEQERRAANARAAGRPVGVAGNPNFRKAGKLTEGCENDAPHDSMGMDTHGT